MNVGRRLAVLLGLAGVLAGLQDLPAGVWGLLGAPHSAFARDALAEDALAGDAWAEHALADEEGAGEPAEDEPAEEAAPEEPAPEPAVPEEAKPETAGEPPAPRDDHAALLSAFTTNMARGTWEGALRALLQQPEPDRTRLALSVFGAILDDPREDLPRDVLAGLEGVAGQRLRAFVARHLLEDQSLVSAPLSGRGEPLAIDALLLRRVGRDDAVATLLLDTELLLDPLTQRRPGYDRLLALAANRLAARPEATTADEAADAVRVLALEGRGPGGERVPDVVAVLWARMSRAEGPEVPLARWLEAFSLLLDTPFPDRAALLSLLGPAGPVPGLAERLAQWADWTTWDAQTRLRVDRDLRAAAAWHARTRSAGLGLQAADWEVALRWAQELIDRMNSPKSLAPFLAADSLRWPRHEIVQRRASARAVRLVTQDAEVSADWIALVATALAEVPDAVVLKDLIQVMSAWRLPADDRTAFHPVGAAIAQRLEARRDADLFEQQRRLLSLAAALGTPQHVKAIFDGARAGAANGADLPEALRAGRRALFLAAIESLSSRSERPLENLASLLPGADADVRRAVARALASGDRTGEPGRLAIRLLGWLVLGAGEEVPSGPLAGASGTTFPDPAPEVREEAIVSLEAFADPASSDLLGAVVLEPPVMDDARKREAERAIERLARQVNARGSEAAADVLQAILLEDRGFGPALRATTIEALAGLVEGLAPPLRARLSAAARAVVEAAPLEGDNAGWAAAELLIRMAALDAIPALATRAASPAATPEVRARWRPLVVRLVESVAAAATAANGADDPQRDTLMKAALEATRSTTPELALELLSAYGSARRAATWGLTAEVAKQLAEDATKPEPVRQAAFEAARSAENALVALDAALGRRRAGARVLLSLAEADFEQARGHVEREAQLRGEALREAVLSENPEIARTVQARIARLDTLLDAERRAALGPDREKLARLAAGASG